MNCPNCGAINIEGSSFCVKCGTNLKNMQQYNTTQIQSMEQLLQSQNQQSVNVNSNFNNINNQTNETPLNINNSIDSKNYNINSNSTMTKMTNKEIVNLNYVSYLISLFIKPFSNFKNNEENLGILKNSVIFSLIISILMMLATLFKTMVSSIFVRGYFNNKLKIEFSNLGDLNYLDLILKNLIIYIIIIGVIALIYYIVALIFKKSTNYFKLLSITSSSFVPYIILSLVVSSILNIIWNPLGIISMIIGIIYSLLIFIKLILEEISFDNHDISIYFNLICLSVIGIAGYFLYNRLFVASVSGGLDQIFNLFS